MNNKVQNIFFDFDGTLVDTGPGILKATHYALLKYGIEENDESNLRRFVGPPLAEAFAEHYGFSSRDSVLAVLKFREYYLETGWTECGIYPQVEDMLSSLRDSGRRLIIATGKPEDLAVKIARRFGIDHYFDVIRGAYVDEEGEHRTDKKEIITSITDDLNITDFSSCIMVGDRANDITGAHRSGIKAIGVLWGYGSEKELSGAGADYSAATPPDVSEMIINDLL
ncbi:MAG: HAD hydrolase-like protein [Lachnospiraceae bacterium]|nr:HAD hydrolase-like protein [Lachnospiraceae bacterium]